MTYISSIFAAGLDQVRRSWGWFFAFGILLMMLGVVCIGKAQTATKFLNSGVGLGACDQRSSVARQFVFRVQLAWILSVPAERNHPRSDGIPPDSSSGRRRSRNNHVARCALHSRRTVSRSRGECYPIPQVGMDGLFGTRLYRTRRLPSYHLAGGQHIFHWPGDRHRSHV